MDAKLAKALRLQAMRDQEDAAYDEMMRLDSMMEHERGIDGVVAVGAYMAYWKKNDRYLLISDTWAGFVNERFPGWWVGHEEEVSDCAIELYKIMTRRV